MPRIISEDSVEECVHEAEGELGAMESDEGGEDWDDRDNKGLAPRVPKDVQTPTAKDIEEHNATMIPRGRRVSLSWL